MKHLPILFHHNRPKESFSLWFLVLVVELNILCNMLCSFTKYPKPYAEWIIIIEWLGVKMKIYRLTRFIKQGIHSISANQANVIMIEFEERCVLAHQRKNKHNNIVVTVKRVCVLWINLNGMNRNANKISLNTLTVPENISIAICLWFFLLLTKCWFWLINEKIDFFPLDFSSFSSILLQHCNPLHQIRLFSSQE